LRGMYARHRECAAGNPRGGLRSVFVLNISRRG
jgi:hypothetical protein